MFLLRVSSLDDPKGLQLEHFTPDEIPPYAILSHTWRKDEVIWSDVINGKAEQKEDSFSKVRNTCLQARRDNLEWAWVDSCCIDKSSSAELSEAINSMYAFYEAAQVCYAHLEGVSSTVNPRAENSEFASCKWFTRGWTLQEMLAPSKVVFYSEDWVPIGTKETLKRPIAAITGINEEFLTGTKSVDTASVAKRMSWAAHRKTTRPEDVAYCLMGLFGVNMPMLYGEGTKAFLRLQEEIMKVSDDQSLFAWTDLEADAEAHHGLLAKSPANFAYSNSVMPYQDWEPRPPYQMTNRGLCIDMHMTSREDKSEPLYVAALDCPAPPNYEDGSFLAVYLRKVSHRDHQYARVRVGQFAMVNERGTPQTIYVRQKFAAMAAVEGVFPHHVYQLRKGPVKGQYTVTKVVANKSQDTSLPAILSSSAKARDWIPSNSSFTFKAPKGTGQLAVALVITRDADNERLVVMLGCSDELGVGVDAEELPYHHTSYSQIGHESEVADEPDFQELQQRFRPTPPGRTVPGLEYHRVSIEVDTTISNGSKYLLIDLKVDMIADSLRAQSALEEAKNLYRAIMEREQPDPLLVEKRSRKPFWRRKKGGDQQEAF